MKALITNTLAGLAGLLLTSVGAYAQSEIVAPTGTYVDTFSTGANIFINSPSNVAATYGSSGFNLDLTNKSGTEFYWGDGGGVAYNDSSASAPAFSLNTSANQYILTLDVTAITGGTLQVGAFFFNGNSASQGNLLTNELGASKGGLNITAPGVYTLNMDALAAANGLTTAEAWKGDLYYTGSAAGQSVTFSEFEANGAQVVPEPSTYLLMGVGVFMLFAIRKFRRGSALNA